MACDFGCAPFFVAVIVRSEMGDIVYKKQSRSMCCSVALLRILLHLSGKGFFTSFRMTQLNNTF